MAAADYRLMTDPTGQRIATALENLAPLQATPYIATIPTGQWSGSGSDRYITVTASNVTANSILVPQYDQASSELLNGPVWCVPAAGSFTIHTSAIPSGTVTIMVMFVGVMGEAQYQVLADVYSKSQVDSIVSQSTANINVNTTQQGWGKTLTVNGLYALILVGGTLLLQTYVSGSATLTVSVLNYNGNVMFAKTSTDGVVEFSATSISGTGYKVQKSGNTLLITTPTDTVITAFAYHDT